MARKLKGKSEFTISEINELRQLIILRNKPSTTRTKQKSIRGKMRKKLGFWGQDDWRIYDCQVSDLENLIQTGQISISNS